MKSWILIVSYLWKDTWKRWFEQPGSILARVVVTGIMVSISIVLLVAFSMQVEKIKQQMETFGLDNMLVMETVSGKDLEKGKVDTRFSEIGKWGELLTVKKLLVRGNSSDGSRVAVVSYTEDAVVSLHHYLKYGHSEVLLTKKYPQGMILDVKVEDTWIRTVCLPPRDHEEKLLQGDTLFLPSEQYAYFESTGYSVSYYLKRDLDAPTIEMIGESINAVVANDRRGRVDIRSSAMIKKKLAKLEEQQSILKYTMAGLLGGALALIYGTLSILEFAQQRYVSALLRSFGVPRILLAMRSIIESVVIVNGVAFSVIYGLMTLHDKLFKALKLQNKDMDLEALYLSDEVLWVLVFVNIGVVLSSLPVIRAMGQPVGKVLS